METKDILIVEDIERVRKISEESNSKIVEEVYKRTLDKLRKEILEVANSGRYSLVYLFESSIERESSDKLKDYFERYGYTVLFGNYLETISISW